MENNKKSEGPRTITVSVNNKPVLFIDHKVSGKEIKETAIAQGIEIKPDFVLFEVKGKKLHPIKDDEKVNLHEGQEFRAVTPDDNS